jgi:hypothetical protein
METALGLALVAAVSSSAVQFGKKFNVPSNLSLGVLSLVGGGLYYFLVNHAPEEALLALSSVWGSSVMFYELLAKRFLESK